ncbi:hypothetical protein LIA77_00848 [Sarocladium implicatum]|nr:hypothetical protein LIA77_00848 [Sarocladium implicatum]
MPPYLMRLSQDTANFQLSDCTYQFRRPVPPPTLRIRELQDHLRLARQWLQQVKDHGVNVPGLDLDECLRTLDFTQPVSNETTSPSTTTPGTARSPPDTPVTTPARAMSDQPSASASSSSDRQDWGNMLSGWDRAFTLPSGETCFYGAFSDVSFALRTIELFRAETSVRDGGDFDRLHEAFARVFAKPTSTQHLPPLGTGTYQPHLDASHLIHSFISSQQLRDTAENFTSSDDATALLRVSAALQTLTNAEAHKSEGCREMVQLACHEFEDGFNTLRLIQQDSLVSLQAMLCAATFMLSTGRVTAAHSLTSTASSLALRLGLFSKGMAASKPERRTNTVRILATVMSLDMLTSLILDLTPSLPRDAFDNTGVLTLSREFETEGDLRTAAMLRQVCVLFVPLTLRNLTRSASRDLPEAEHEKIMEDIRRLETAHTGFRRWKRDVSSLLTALGIHEEKQMIRDLEMIYNFCQLIVFRSHLHHLRSVAVGGSMSKAQSYHALACLKVATTTIGHVDRSTDSTELRSLSDSWLGIYTIYTAVMCLVFLIAAHPGTARPSVAWQRAYRGIRILAACSCENNMAAACLRMIKNVTTELSHTVYFDYAEIEATVRRVCDDEHLKGASVRSSPSISTAGSEGANGFMDIPADRMLFQADTLASEFDFRDILHLSDTEC